MAKKCVFEALDNIREALDDAIEVQDNIIKAGDEDSEAVLANLRRQNAIIKRRYFQILNSVTEKP
jgi:hypothetical protein